MTSTQGARLRCVLVVAPLFESRVLTSLFEVA